jgi:plasmid maintenance system antidote protein VapI
VPANRITQIVQGKRSVTGDTALRLGHWFSMNPQFWLNLQSAYDCGLRGRRRVPKSRRFRRGSVHPANTLKSLMFISKFLRPFVVSRSPTDIPFEEVSVAA